MKKGVKVINEVMKGGDKQMQTLTDYIKALHEDIEYVVVLGERTHWIFSTDSEVIDQAWSDTMDVVEVVSETDYSVVVRVAYGWDA